MKKRKSSYQNTLVTIVITFIVTTLGWALFLQMNHAIDWTKLKSTPKDNSEWGESHKPIEQMEPEEDCQKLIGYWVPIQGARNELLIDEEGVFKVIDPRTGIHSAADYLYRIDKDALLYGPLKDIYPFYFRFRFKEQIGKTVLEVYDNDNLQGTYSKKASK